MRREWKRLRHLRSQGRTRKVDATPVRALIYELLSKGISISQIAYRSGVSLDSLADMRDGVNKRCYPETYHALMDTSWPMVSPKDDPDGFVISIGTTRRVKALMSLGWTSARIAEAADLTYEQVRSQLRRGRYRVRAFVALGVVKAYDKLWYRLPEAKDRKDADSIARTRALAKRMRWASPLAWDEDIDDPNAKPHGQVGDEE